MNPQNSQHPPMTPERAKAALGNATLLQSFLLPAHSADSKQSHMLKTGQIQPEEPKEPEKPQESQQKPDDLDAKFKEFEKTVATMIDEKIGGLKSDIENALHE